MPPFRHGGRVEKLDPAAVFLNDLGHNREAQPGALLAGGDVWLEQALPVFLRQPDAVVDDIDDDGGALLPALPR